VALVTGLPKDAFASAGRVLRNQRVWLRGANVMGLNRSDAGESDARDFDARAIAAIEMSQETRGLVCRSVQTLHLWWVDARDAAWADLSLDEINRLLVCRNEGDTGDEQPTLRLGRRRDGASARSRLAATATAAATREFDEAVVGGQLTVKLLAPRADSKNWLMSSARTNLILECVCPPRVTAARFLGEELVVEVIARDDDGWHRKLHCTLPGERLFKMQLPSWVRRQPERQAEYEAERHPSESTASSAEVAVRAESQLSDGAIEAAIAATVDGLRHGQQVGNRVSDWPTSASLAREWIKRHPVDSDEELKCVPALNAMYIACTIGVDGSIPRFEEQLRSLARRASRTVHLYKLFEHDLWARPLHNRPLFTSKNLLEQRLGHVIDFVKQRELNDPPGLSLYDLQKLRQFALAVALAYCAPSSSSDLFYQAIGLLAAAGQARAREIVAFMDQPGNRSNWLLRLAELERYLPAPGVLQNYNERAGRHSDDVINSCAGLLGEVIDELRIQRVDPILLQPLPKLSLELPYNTGTPAVDAVPTQTSERHMRKVFR